jgi:hypothetical protein
MWTENWEAWVLFLTYSLWINKVATLFYVTYQVGKYATIHSNLGSSRFYGNATVACVNIETCVF